MTTKSCGEGVENHGSKAVFMFDMHERENE